MAKVIFHIDLNAFFATAETLKNPSLIGKPIAVGGTGKKGVLSTASYEARKYGVHSAMPVHEALRLCPELIIIPGDYAWYEKLSRQFINLIYSYTDIVEQASIDECYADMTHAITKFAYPLDLACDIQKKLKERVGLTCSIGIGPNKFLAKIGSDYKKPNGITIIRKREIQNKLWPLPIDAIGGIGKKTAPILKQNGINYIGDLVKPENTYMIHKLLHKNADYFIDLANGIDHSTLCDFHELKSISQSTTFDINIIDYEQIEKVFQSLVKNVCARLASEQMSGNNICITIRYYDFETINRSVTLDKYVSNYDEIIGNCLSLFELHDKGKEIRLLGVAINNLKNNAEIDDIDLFNYYQSISNIDELIHSLNNEMSQNYLIKASDIIQKNKDKK